MDSGNSGGSTQSSSGDDEEYDSQPFFNPSVPSFASISNETLPHHRQSRPHLPTTFDPQPHNFDAFSQSTAQNQNPNTTSLYNNLDLVWSRGLRSDPNYTDFGRNLGAIPSSSASPSSSSSQSLLAAQQSLGQVQFPNISNSMPLRLDDGNARPSPPSDQTNQVKNPKKRTRASRRAPTTVLTTDTTNFRQMVQEFTGIPSAPFSAGSTYSRRLGLFSTNSSSAMRSGHLDPLWSLYPLRPSAQKSQFSSLLAGSSSPSLFNTSMIDAIARTATNISTTNNSTVTNSTSIATSSSNYQLLPSDIGLLSPKQAQAQAQTQNLFAMQSPILGYEFMQSSTLGQPSNKHPLLASNSVPIISSKYQANPSVSSMDELGSTSGTQPRNVNVNSCSAAASASELHVEKSLEIVSSRGEGTVDSWICPSD